MAATAALEKGFIRNRSKPLGLQQRQPRSRIGI
jgi:hypothetical protein